MDKLITGVYLFRQLPDGIKKANGIKVGASVPRFDIVGFNGDYEFLKQMVNKKNQCNLSLVETFNFVKADQKRMADFALRNSKVGNLSSLYYKASENKGKYFGNTNDADTIKVGSKVVPNPLLGYKDHLLLMQLSEDRQELVLVVVHKGRSLLQYFYPDYINGKYDGIIQDKLQFLNTDFGYLL